LGTTKYGNIKIHVIFFLMIFKEWRQKKYKPKYEIIEGDKFFSLEEIHILYESSSTILVKNNNIIQASTKIASTINNQVTGLQNKNSILPHLDTC
jgi:hypothetical protein